MTDKVVTWQEFEKHIYNYDCWVMIDQHVYNVNDYIVQHPGGDDILVRFSGRDGTATFKNVPHSEYAISLRNARLVGKIESPEPPAGYLDRIADKKAKSKKDSKKKDKIVKREDKIPLAEVALHKSEESCWVVLNGKVLDVTSYLDEHPGGVNKIMEWAGQDASKAFKQANHSMDAIKTSQKFVVGDVEKSFPLLVIAIVLAILGAAAFFILS